MAIPLGLNNGSTTLDHAGRLRGLGVQQQSPVGPGLADILLVDANGYPLVRRDFDQQPVAAGVAGQTHALAVGGYADESFFRALRVDRMGNLRSGVDQVLFYDAFEGALKNSQKWLESATTMTADQSVEGMRLNAAASTALTTGIVETSYLQLPKIQFGPLHYRCRAFFTNLVANSFFECGFGAPSSPTTLAAIPNGAFWRIDASNIVTARYAYNGSELPVTLTINNGGAATFANLINNGNAVLLDIVLDDDDIQFTMFDPSLTVMLAWGKIAIPKNQRKLLAVTHLPVFHRLANAGSAPASAPVVVVSGVDVSAKDSQYNFSADVLAALNRASSELLPTTFTQSGQFVNNAEPASAALSNTAAGYATLGGKFQFAAVAGAPTDYALFSFPVPAPYAFVNTGYRLGGWNTGAAVATTPSLLTWGVGHNGASANLATGGHLREMIGAQSYAVGSAIGVSASELDITYSARVTMPGRHHTTILRMPVGTATAAQVLAGYATPKGFFL